jgi:YfiH family protein
MVRGGFERRERNGVVWYAVPFLDRTGLVRAAFTTRTGGASTGEAAAMNFSFKRKDDPDNVRENYRRICAACGFAPDRLVISRQVHGTYIHEATDPEIGRGIFDGFENVEADGLMTDRRGAALVKHTADCVPVYILDVKTPAIALVHAGWRGTLAGIAGEALGRMAEVYGAHSADCLAAIGLSIGPCCFEVGRDVAEAFEGRFPGRGIVDASGRLPKVNLWKCNAIQLADAGVPDEGISVSGLCTACDTATFYSHRKEKGRTGAMAAILELI